jgi:hypothetical protein
MSKILRRVCIVILCLSLGAVAIVIIAPIPYAKIDDHSSIFDCLTPLFVNPDPHCKPRPPIYFTSTFGELWSVERSQFFVLLIWFVLNGLVLLWRIASPWRHKKWILASEVSVIILAFGLAAFFKHQPLAWGIFTKATLLTGSLIMDICVCIFVVTWCISVPLEINLNFPKKPRTTPDPTLKAWRSIFHK